MKQEPGGFSSIFHTLLPFAGSFVNLPRCSYFCRGLRASGQGIHAPNSFRQNFQSQKRNRPPPVPLIGFSYLIVLLLALLLTITIS